MSTSTASVETATVPTSRTRSSLVPLVCGGVACGVAGMLLVVDPAESSVLPPCPLHAATGLWCPGCGLTRATSRLLHGDLAGALGYNLLAPVVLVGLALGWWSWLRSTQGRPSAAWLQRVPFATWIVLGVAVVAFVVARNTDRFAYLAP